MWRFVALEVATVFAAAMFLARNWREWGEFYMSFSVLLTMIMPVLVVCECAKGFANILEASSRVFTSLSLRLRWYLVYYVTR